MTPDDVIELVHKIDALQAKRGELDVQIVALKEALSIAIGGSRGVIAARSVATVSNRRSRESPRMSSAMRHIQTYPRTDYLSLAQAVYDGHAPKDVKNTRTLVFHMKNAGMIEGDPGRWRVVQSVPKEQTPKVPFDGKHIIDHGDDSEHSAA